MGRHRQRHRLTPLHTNPKRKRGDTNPKRKRGDTNPKRKRGQQTSFPALLRIASDGRQVTHHTNPKRKRGQHPHNPCPPLPFNSTFHNLFP